MAAEYRTLAEQTATQQHQLLGQTQLSAANACSQGEGWRRSTRSEADTRYKGGVRFKRPFD